MGRGGGSATFQALGAESWLPPVDTPLGGVVASLGEFAVRHVQALAHQALLAGAPPALATSHE